MDGPLQMQLKGDLEVYRSHSSYLKIHTLSQGRDIKTSVTYQVGVIQLCLKPEAHMFECSFDVLQCAHHASGYRSSRSW